MILEKAILGCMEVNMNSNKQLVYFTLLGETVMINSYNFTSLVRELCIGRGNTTQQNIALAVATP